VGNSVQRAVTGSRTLRVAVRTVHSSFCSTEYLNSSRSVSIFVIRTTSASSDAPPHEKDNGGPRARKQMLLW
jgi:hypothetical protein